MALVGINPADAPQLPITVLQGRLPVAGHGEVAVTEGLLQRLEIADRDSAVLLGREVTVGAPQLIHLGGDTRVRSRWRRLTIVGVIAQEAVPAGDLLTDSAEVEADRQWSLAGETAPGFARPTSPYAGLFVVTRGIANVPLVRQQITVIGFSTQAPENPHRDRGALSPRRRDRALRHRADRPGDCLARDCERAAGCRPGTSPGDRRAQGNRCARHRHHAHLPARGRCARLAGRAAGHDRGVCRGGRSSPLS